MIEQFDGKSKISDKFGNKANSLIAMRRAGFNVPNGFVLDSDSFDDFLRSNGRILKRYASRNRATTRLEEALRGAQ